MQGIHQMKPTMSTSMGTHSMSLYDKVVKTLTNRPKVRNEIFLSIHSGQAADAMKSIGVKDYHLVVASLKPDGVRQIGWSVWRFVSDEEECLVEMLVNGSGVRGSCVGKETPTFRKGSIQ
jgi:hypothetical protein